MEDFASLFTEKNITSVLIYPKQLLATNSISFTLIVADVDVEFHPNGKAFPRKLNRIFVSKLLPSWKNADDILLEHENLRFVSLVCLILLYWWYHSIIIYTTFYGDRDIKMDRFIFRTIFFKKISPS